MTRSVTSSPAITALIAEDEPLLREALETQLRTAWPALDVVARARNGREAIELFERCLPDVCFLDVHMPGLTGLEAAQHIGKRAHLVFVTAFDHYAVQAFAQGVLDYLVKPIDPARLAETVSRLQERLRTSQPASNTEAMLERLTALLDHSPAKPLRWLRASVGSTVTLIPVASIDYLRAEDKYTTVAWRDQGEVARQATIRMSLKEIAAQLDAQQFVQVHRSIIVNLNCVAQMIRGENDTGELRLRGRSEVLPVSRNYLALFRQM